MKTNRALRTLLILASLASLASLAIGCSDAEEAAGPAPEAAEEVAEPIPDPHPHEACMRGVIVSYQGALGARPEVSRSQDEARARADQLHARVAGGEAIADVARAEGDGSRAERGGQLGTFPRLGWPTLHARIKDAVFGVAVGELTDVVEAEYGYIFVERCLVEKANSRHILIRYAGAQNAGDGITRSRDEARTLASDARIAVMAPGADFEAIVREWSEDSSAGRGGNLGPLGKGLLHAPYEEALFALEIDGISEVVETPFGFHVIQRLAMPTDG